MLASRYYHAYIAGDCQCGRGFSCLRRGRRVRSAVAHYLTAPSGCRALIAGTAARLAPGKRASPGSAVIKMRTCRDPAHRPRSYAVRT
jgi:hypothetical protein